MFKNMRKESVKIEDHVFQVEIGCLAGKVSKSIKVEAGRKMVDFSHDLNERKFIVMIGAIMNRNIMI